MTSVKTTVEASLEAIAASRAATSVLEHVESIVLFVSDIEAAATWYAEIFGTTVRHENPKYAFIQAPGVVIGFHPADAKCPGGVGGTTAYWEVERLDDAIAFLTGRGAKLFRGPGITDFSASVAMLIDPFGCTIGLNQSTERSLRKIRGQQSGSAADLAEPVSRHTRRGDG